MREDSCSICWKTGAPGAAQAARDSRVKILRGHQRKQLGQGISDPGFLEELLAGISPEDEQKPQE
jgi:hypothetical protein